jgi:hypothetical protein
MSMGCESCLVVTNSSRTCFLECPYKYFLNYVRRLSPRDEPEYFTWGKIWHVGKSQQELNRPIEDEIAKARAELEKRAPSVGVLVRFEEMCNQLPAVADAHLLKWAEDEKNFDDMNIEGVFSLPLPCGALFQGKYDKIVRDIRTNEVITWERKTAQNTGDEYYAAIQLDSQPKGYLLGVQRCVGLHTTKVMYDVVKKPQLREKKSQTREQFLEEVKNAYLLDRDRYFERRLISFQQEEIDEYLYDVDGVAQAIQWHLENAVWPKHHPRNRFGKCEYLSICLSNGHISDKFYVRDQDETHPELKIRVGE